MAKLFRSLLLVVGLLSLTSRSYAVEYVKICSLYGSSFYYIPGTDTCLNPTTGETRQQTIGGLWIGHIPSPGTWVGNPNGSCNGGRLVKVGTFTASNLTVNSYGKYQTALVPLTLGTGDFIASVLMSGGFNVTDKSTFCLSFYDVSTEAYALLGCENTRPLMEQPAALSFTPLTSIPPASFTSPFNLVGHNAEENWGTSTFDGALTCWVCVQHATPKAQ